VDGVPEVCTQRVHEMMRQTNTRDNDARSIMRLCVDKYEINCVHQTKLSCPMQQQLTDLQECRAASGGTSLVTLHVPGHFNL